ncbi:MAG TPA: M48 family metallopeptidase [Myxococcota bacterium]|nr:M48 family metallopeptidase [Myxococcota bacterium]
MTRLAAAAALVALTVACQARLGAPAVPPERAETARTELGAEAVAAYLADVERVASIAHRLRAAGSTLCGDATSALLGAYLLQRIRDDDLGTFWEALLEKLGVGEAPTVVGVAPGSPAARAGLERGDRILALNGRAVGRTRELQAALRHVRSGELVLRIGRGSAERDVGLPVEIGCDAWLALDFGVEASTGKRRGREGYVTTLFVRFARGDDELAAVIAHEIAHLVLGDPLGAYPRQELAADRLALGLCAAAGFDSAAALRLWERWSLERPWLVTRNLEWYRGRREPPHGRIAERLVAMRAALLAAGIEARADATPRTAP